MACEAKSVGLHPASLSDDAKAEIFLNDVTVEGPAGVLRLEEKRGGKSRFQVEDFLRSN